MNETATLRRDLTRLTGRLDCAVARRQAQRPILENVYVTPADNGNATIWEATDSITGIEIRAPIRIDDLAARGKAGTGGLLLNVAHLKKTLREYAPSTPLRLWAADGAVAGLMISAVDDDPDQYNFTSAQPYAWPSLRRIIDERHRQCRGLGLPALVEAGELLNDDLARIDCPTDYGRAGKHRPVRQVDSIRPGGKRRPVAWFDEGRLKRIEKSLRTVGKIRIWCSDNDDHNLVSALLITAPGVRAVVMPVRVDPGRTFERAT